MNSSERLTVENFGGSQERLHFAGRHPAKELATVGPQRKISAPADTCSDSQLTVENFGGSQERLHFAGRHPAKELATVGPQRKISAPAG
ncbi:hypothetical protein JYU34_002191 [Plutella xylostella]|uniref:Uncharacterized protein n=1 Tax=Plutella xylostella TaxID=51655 RepID=A0ABQ7R1L7_PLUXY|nr:hypothetical protein JYU34_002191 [Plutella xylostella]